MVILEQASDEALFNNMTQGDVFAHDILLYRYERIGRQIAGSLVRINKLYDLTDQDFIEIIDSAVEKSFRYFEIGKSRFYTFCRANLNKMLNEAVIESLNRKEQVKNRIDLDSTISSESLNTFHEIVEDKRVVDYSTSLELNDYLLYLSSPNSSQISNIIKVRMLYEMGYTMREICKKTGLCDFTVRKILKDKN